MDMNDGLFPERMKNNSMLLVIVHRNKKFHREMIRNHFCKRRNICFQAVHEADLYGVHIAARPRPLWRNIVTPRHPMLQESHGYRGVMFLLRCLFHHKLIKSCTRSQSSQPSAFIMPAA